MNIDKYKNDALRKASEHQKYLEKLKHKKPRKLDEKMLEIHNKVFSNIDCLECANCCKTTGPLLLEKDIERISKYLRMKPVDFINQYMHKDEDQDWVFKQLPCPFLNNSNYCLIYEVRPKACKEYPHTNRKKFYQINKLTLKNTIICPAAYEVVELLMKSERFW